MTKKEYTNGLGSHVVETEENGVSKKVVTAQDGSVWTVITSGNMTIKKSEWDGQVISLREELRDSDGKLIYGHEINRDDEAEGFFEAEKDGLKNVKIMRQHDDGKLSSYDKQYTDSKGVQHYESYDKGGKLTWRELTYTDEKGVEHTERYDGQGKLLETIKEYTDDKGVNHIEWYDGKGKMKEASKSYTDKKGAEYHEAYDAQGNLKYTLKEYKDEKGVEYSEEYDGKGRLLKKERVVSDLEDGSADYRETYDKKGKLSTRRTIFGDKEVEFDMGRGKLAAWADFMTFGHWARGGRFGKVKSSRVSGERAAVNARLKAILKNSSLSGDEKKTKMREIVAQYREETGYKDPNAKVSEALKKYLPPKKRGSR